MPSKIQFPMLLSMVGGISQELCRATFYRKLPTIPKALYFLQEKNPPFKRLKELVLKFHCFESSGATEHTSSTKILQT